MAVIVTPSIALPEKSGTTILVVVATSAPPTYIINWYLLIGIEKYLSVIVLSPSEDCAVRC
jgi:hypothetical protein